MVERRRVSRQSPAAGGSRVFSSPAADEAECAMQCDDLRHACEAVALTGRLTWLGHATVLVELDGARVLTDPVLRRRIAHLRRRVPVPPDPGRLDAILISHPHHDHLDLPSLRRLDPAAPVVAPPGAAAALRRTGRTVHELGPGAELELAGVRVRAVEAVHDGRRLPLGPPADAVGFVVAGSQEVYFAGDTEHHAGMAEVGERLDAALLPIWGWGPRLGPGHMDPRQAAEALALLRPALVVPIHWGTYALLGRRDDGSALAPAEAFAAHAAELAPDVRVAVLAPGGSVEVPVRITRPE
jgi:L-ascorbate metabolism protein UlaG (beta-lactamase superfamily)